MVRVVDDEDRLRAVPACDFDLSHHGRMHRVRLSFERASRIVLLRLVRENQHGFAGGVDARVVVIVKRWCRNTVTGEHYWQRLGGRRLITRRRHDLVVASDVEPHLASTRMQRDRIARLHRHPRRHFEALKERAAIARGLEAGFAEFGGDVFSRAFEAGAAVSTPFEIVRREKLHVLHDMPSDRYGGGPPAAKRHRARRQADQLTHVSLQYLIDDNLVAARQHGRSDALEPGRANRNGPRAHGRLGSVVPIQRHERAEDAARARHDTLTE